MSTPGSTLCCQALCLGIFRPRLSSTHIQRTVSKDNPLRIDDRSLKGSGYRQRQRAMVTSRLCFGFSAFPGLTTSANLQHRGELLRQSVVCNCNWSLETSHRSKTVVTTGPGDSDTPNVPETEKSPPYLPVADRMPLDSGIIPYRIRFSIPARMIDRPHTNYDVLRRGTRFLRPDPGAVSGHWVFRKMGLISTV
ncbi:predicted protein [Uncinocarpus reesii 1704]|uniref:Uncharacterized protein n=1 Tax=Uncinocarpus reesii (strain UAMH 1704) TaxID=336963 RepID=C4JHF8_UNCRE|nr:uncharacterized protein UREG_01321 [Uncinocarpus reesii 1704]EEP76472.1 predicted protein [Uncinocarpus reesii 1704]